MRNNAITLLLLLLVWSIPIVLHTLIDKKKSKPCVPCPSMPGEKEQPVEDPELAPQWRALEKRLGMSIPRDAAVKLLEVEQILGVRLYAFKATVPPIQIVASLTPNELLIKNRNLYLSGQWSEFPEEAL